MEFFAAGWKRSFRGKCVAKATLATREVGSDTCISLYVGGLGLRPLVPPKVERVSLLYLLGKVIDCSCSLVDDVGTKCVHAFG